MNDKYTEFNNKAFSTLQKLARECPDYEDAQMMVGGAESISSLSHQDIFKSIDTEWISVIEKHIPALDLIIRNPSVAIEDVDEILPVEISRHVTEKSIKHLAQHTNLILEVKGDEVIPQKILNVYHDETKLTYENKFVNTLIARLMAFVDKRFKVLKNGMGAERKYNFEYSTSFEHSLPDTAGSTSARINLGIELTSPLNVEESESNLEVNERYIEAMERIKKINLTLRSYTSSAFCQALGKSYVRPPVIRTNAILKNKNLKECLSLWEYIESFDKAGYKIHVGATMEKPSDEFIGDLFGSVAMQYTSFYYGVAENDANKPFGTKRLFDYEPEFKTEFDEEEIEDYLVYDSEYKKMVPVSRLLNNRKKLSDDEKEIYKAMTVALKADDILSQGIREREEELRRIAREKRKAEEERRRQEEEARRLWEEEHGKRIQIKQRRSFMARYIQASELIQDNYEIIKNALLSYKGVKSRISWKCDTFRKGRLPVAKMDVKGKRLYVYFNIDPKELEGTKYRFKDNTEKTPDFPVLLRVRSGRGRRQALELIERFALKYNLKRLDREPVSYAMDYEDDAALIAKGLIKLVESKGFVATELTPEKEEAKRLAAEKRREEAEALRREKEEKRLEEERLKKEAEERRIQEEEARRLEEERLEQERLRLEEEERLRLEELSKRRVTIKQRKSFTARYIQASELIQDNYEDIKNALLSLKGVKSRISWKCDTFRKGRLPIAKMDVKGKGLYLYLNIDPKELAHTKYRVRDNGAKTPDFPTLFKVKSARGRRHALELIDKIAEDNKLKRLEIEPVSYVMDYEDDAALIEKGLIKIPAVSEFVLKN